MIPILAAVDPLAGQNADRINSITLGLNWWIQRNVRFTANATWEQYDDRVAFDNRSEDSLFGLVFRAQVDF
jgi:phosphate-selective porin